MAAIDAGALAARIIETLRAEAGGGARQISSLARRQIAMMARQAALLTEGRIAGQIAPDLYRFLVGQLKDNATNLVRSIVALQIVTIERAWNAVVGLIWGAINDALGGAGLARLPVPRAPRA